MHVRVTVKVTEKWREPMDILGKIVYVGRESTCDKRVEWDQPEADLFSIAEMLIDFVRNNPDNIVKVFGEEKRHGFMATISNGKNCADFFISATEMKKTYLIDGRNYIWDSGCGIHEGYHEHCDEIFEKWISDDTVWALNTNGRDAYYHVIKVTKGEPKIKKAPDAYGIADNEGFEYYYDM